MTGGYWQTRKNLRYYDVAIALAKQYAANGGAVLDVGSHDCEYITKLRFFKVKHVLDLTVTPNLLGVRSFQMDFMQFKPDRIYDLVLCLQVLEHVPEPAEFCGKLMATGKCVIISVPYMWPYGKCKTHIHDPIDQAKLLGWTARPWESASIVQDGKWKRLIAVFFTDAISDPIASIVKPPEAL